MTAMPPIPVSRYLVPAVPAAVPDGFTLVDQSLSTGLPLTIPLFADLTLTLALPTGLAAQWRDADPTAVVSQSADQESPQHPAVGPTTIGGVDRAPARLVLLRSGALVASVPLVAGLQHVLPDSADGVGGLIDLAVVSWDLRAGNVLGAGDFGSRLRLGWREADKAADEFVLPEINPRILSRLEDPFGIYALWWDFWMDEWGWIQQGELL
jgi:hypothetical protein